MKIRILREGDPLWGPLSEYAAACPWRAGPYLARLMRENGFSGWERAFAATERGSVIGFCTLMRTDCISDVPYTPYIGFVFVDESCRGRRISQRMIRHAMAYARGLGFEKVYLTSREVGLYEKYGFVRIDEKTDRWGNPETVFMQPV